VTRLAFRSIPSLVLLLGVSAAFLCAGCEGSFNTSPGSASYDEARVKSQDESIQRAALARPKPKVRRRTL